jgi:hypothetical protein
MTTEDIRDSIIETESALLGRLILDFPDTASAIDAAGLEAGHLTLEQHQILYRVRARSTRSQRR